MKNNYIQNWLTKGDNDLKVAQHEILNRRECITDAVCFHSQQAVEKYLKAFLILHEIDFGKTHNIEYLIKICTSIDSDFETINTGNLSFYAVEIRYPDDFYIPTFKEAKESIKIASEIKQFVLNKGEFPE